jgi:hypothetical protein
MGSTAFYLRDQKYVVQTSRPPTITRMQTASGFSRSGKRKIERANWLARRSTAAPCAFGTRLKRTCIISETEQPPMTAAFVSSKHVLPALGDVPLPE